jgi:hypothetical protein
VVIVNFGPAPIIVVLNEDEIAEAVECGAGRFGRVVRRGSVDKRDPHGTMRINAKDRHLLGARGERACCKAFDIPWVDVDGYRVRPDIEVSVGVEVRTRTKGGDERLIVRDDDHDERMFVLVVGDTTSPEYEVVGWLFGFEAKRAEWRKDPGGRGPAFFIEQQHLKPMSALLMIVRTSMATRPPEGGMV